MTPAPWLPPIPGLHRRDPEHRYWLGETEFPISVTGVLSVLKSDFAMARIEATRSTWEPRGHQTHRALELFLALEYSSFPIVSDEMDGLLQGDHADWIQPLITHERWDQVQVIASERPTCCVARGVAGTFDTAYLDPALPVPARLVPSGVVPDRPAGVTGPARVLADLKTLGENGSTYDTRAQIGGYMALEATWGNHYDYGQTIWARPGSTTFSPLYSRQECLTAWAGAWATWRALNHEPPPF